MQYTAHYDSPIGRILLAADREGLTGLWFDGQKYYASGLEADHREGQLPVIDEMKRWLDIYFTGREPAFMPPVHMIGTPFQLAVWTILCEIPYGMTSTYGAVAKEYARRNGLGHMSYQAIGGAIGHNRISVLIPCHRVLSKDGSLNGYAGGIDKKKALLLLEGAKI